MIIRNIIKDEMTDALIVITNDHHEIHEGDSFTCNYGQTSPTNIGEMTIIAFITPNNGKLVHMFSEASSTAASSYTVYENSNLDLNEGTNLVVYNRNRESSKTSYIRNLITTPVIGVATSFTVAQAAGANLSITTPIYKKYLGAGLSGADTSGETRDNFEFILKSNTQYAFVVASTTGDDNTHNIILNWYEHGEE